MAAGDPTGLKAMFPTIAFAAAEADRLGLKRLLMEGGRWNAEHARLDEEQRLRNLQLLPSDLAKRIDNDRHHR